MCDSSHSPALGSLTDSAKTVAMDPAFSFNGSHPDLTPNPGQLGKIFPIDGPSKLTAKQALRLNAPILAASYQLGRSFPSSLNFPHGISSLVPALDLCKQDSLPRLRKQHHSTSSFLAAALPAYIPTFSNFFHTFLARCRRFPEYFAYTIRTPSERGLPNFEKNLARGAFDFKLSETTESSRTLLLLSPPKRNLLPLRYRSNQSLHLSDRCHHNSYA